MNNIEKPSVELTIAIRDHKFKVNFPTSGEMIDIAVLKAKLSDNQYSNLLLQASLEGPIASRLIDAYSFFQIMAPELKKSLATESFYDLSILDSLELVNVYDEQIQPWLNEWTKTINNRIEELRGNTKKKLV